MNVDAIIYLLSIFVMAVFVGYYVVWSVTPALHTPLMSVTNAISSVIIVGALVAIGADVSADDQAGAMTRWLGFGCGYFGVYQYFRRLSGDPAHARHVS